MSAWPGWLADFQAGLGYPETGDNKNFLEKWATYEQTPCHRNPLIASHHVKGATNCQRLNGLNTAQNYPSRTKAINATRAQINSGAYVHLHAALESGHPLDYTPATGLTLDLQKWGALAYSKQVESETGAGASAFGAPAANTVMGAWSRWMRILAHKGPQAHRRILNSTARARRIAR